MGIETCIRYRHVRRCILHRPHLVLHHLRGGHPALETDHPLLRTTIAFCLNCFLWFFSVCFDDFSETAQGLMLFLLEVLMLVFAVAVFLKQRWKWQSTLVFSIPFVTLIIIHCCGGYFIMS